ncbi:hypothetical protein KDL01_40075 [Actinospica durhamensis]|uniref:Uncharacterized protein n=1 Tax=Actinospica durhamensis TaxID=1508375 RepID=A0A941EWL3_9ACTN|nr:hypothetical protein [Actinospica durhamensis]MBR7839522.1 hypothetical protein [Actinospica durhamensis]
MFEYRLMPRRGSAAVPRGAAYTVPLAEITGVTATPRGLRISRAGQPAIMTGALQKSQWAEDYGNEQTSADDDASDILTAVGRLASNHKVPL